MEPGRNTKAERRYLRDKFNEIPRYLFRVSTPRSDGTTDRLWVKSKDAKNGADSSRVDILSRDNHLAVESMLNRHLRWWGLEKDEDNLVSWTSSLLLALQYITYRHNQDKCSLLDIFLFVIDTTRFPKEVFLRDMDLIEAYASRGSGGKNFGDLRRKKDRELTGSFYFGEYLSQGALKIEDKCQFVAAQEIRDQNLACLRPDFGNFTGENPLWSKKVIRLRQAFYDEKAAKAGEQPQITEKELRAAIDIAQLFESGWRLPIAANFIALLPRRNRDDAILQAFRSFTKEERGQCSPLKTKVMAYNTLPEVQQFEVIIRSVYEDFWSAELQDQLTEVEGSLRTALTRVVQFKHSMLRSDRNSTMTNDNHEAVRQKVEKILALAQNIQGRASNFV